MQCGRVHLLVVAALWMAAIGCNCQRTEMPKTLHFVNQLDEPVWVAARGRNKDVVVRKGGWMMRAKGQTVADVPDTWAGRFWARTECDRAGKCQTGSCGNPRCADLNGEPPKTIVEFAFDPRSPDQYGISLEDGFNVKAAIEPLQRQRCPPVRCDADINADCPAELRKEVDGATVGCLSACAVYKTAQYCCKGEYEWTDTCKPGDWDVDYARFFKTHCPDAKSYKFDNNNTTFSCSKAAYRVVFG